MIVTKFFFLILLNNYFYVIVKYKLKYKLFSIWILYNAKYKNYKNTLTFSIQLNFLFFYKKLVLIFYQSNFRDNIKTYTLLTT